MIHIASKHNTQYLYLTFCIQEIDVITLICSLSVHGKHVYLVLYA